MDNVSNLAIPELLERGEILHYPVCPFPLPQGTDLSFLLEQQLASRRHKNISYNPKTGRVGGFHQQGLGQEDRLRSLLSAFSQGATNWLAQLIPQYAAGWKLDLVNFSPEEEATRRLRVSARNDLLHIDSFPNRPSYGHRLLRLFVNIHPTEARVWVTSDPLGELLARYGQEVGLPTGRMSRTAWLRDKVCKLFQPTRQTPEFDAFMLRFHHFLKFNDEFQEKARKRFWKFEPGSAWLVFTDSVTYASLRGRAAIDHSYFISPEALALPAESPAALLERGISKEPFISRAAG